MRVSEQVENLLKYLPKCRSSDKELFIAYMQRFGMELTKDQEDKFRKMPSMETIRRSRQLIQEQGKYPASEQMDTLRHEKYKEMRQNPELILSENYRS